MSGSKAAALAFLLFLVILGAILLVLHFIGVLVLAIAVIGLFALVGLIVFIVAFGLLMIFLGFYYMLKKTPVVQEYGDYRLDSVKGKEDWENKG